MTHKVRVIPSAARNLALLRYAEYCSEEKSRPQTIKTYCVYIMTNKCRTLYTGVTSNLERRVLQHRDKLLPGFTARYNIDRLVYFEACGDVVAAITREKQIKSWSRMKKVALIESMNRDWKDLSAGWYGVQCGRVGL